MIAAVALLAQAAAPGFAPLCDRPYLLHTEERREVAGQPRRFVAERRLVFHRDASGLLLDVTLTDLSTDAPAEVARRFLLGAGGLKGRTVRFRLAADGTPAAIDDEAAVWAALLAGFRAMTPTRPAVHAAVSRDPAAALAALPAPARLAIVGAALTGLGTDPALLPPPGTRAVSVPSEPGAAADVRLAGTESSERTAAGLVRLVTRAGADGVVLRRTRIFDPATGLLASDEEQTERRVGDRVQIVSTTRQLDMVS